MVLYFLYIKAEIEGISSISRALDANICIDVRNPITDEIRSKVVIDPTEFVEQEEGSREPPHHFSISWEGEKKKSVLTILTPDALKSALKKKKITKGKAHPYTPRAMTAEDNNEFVPVLAFDTRGIEPLTFHSMEGEFIVESEGGGTFDRDQVDLSDGDWADYDEANDLAVSIVDFESKFESL